MNVYRSILSRYASPLPETIPFLTPGFVQEYKSGFWHRITLYDLGHLTQLGHGHVHSPCYSPGPALDLTVLDGSGIHKVKIRFCECHESSFSSKRTQLLRAGWYPASLADPESCATFRALEEFHMLHLTGALNVHDFIQALERRTDSSRIELTPVSCCGSTYLQFLKSSE